MSESQFEYKPAADIGMGEFERLRSVKREPGLVSSIAHGAATLGLRTYLKTYHRMRIEGVERLPVRPPFVVIANHASHLDALVLAAALPAAARGCVFPIAAGDVFFESIAVSAFASMFVNALPLWRKRVTRHAMDDLRTRLTGGDCGYILFPEGARTRDGKPLPFKPGLGRLVAETNVPVVPCYLHGVYEALPAHSKLPRPVKIRICVGEPLRFDGTPNTREGWETVAQRTCAAVFGLGGVVVEGKKASAEAGSNEGK